MIKLITVSITLVTILIAGCKPVTPYNDSTAVVVFPNGQTYTTSKISTYYYPYTPYGNIPASPSLKGVRFI